jgi:hypothetical protein
MTRNKQKICFLILFGLISCSALRAENLPYADYKTAHWGFVLGINAMDFGINPNLTVLDGKVYQADVASIMPGFTVGIIGGLRLSEHFSLRLTPCLHLSDRTLSYVNDQDDEVLKTNIKTTLITVPFYVRFSSDRVGEYRPYLIAGGGISFDLARDRQKPVLLNMMDYYIDFGVGCTFYFTLFRLSPELKFSMGFNNLLTPMSEREKDLIDPEDYKLTDALSRLTSRMFTLTFNFE